MEDLFTLHHLVIRASAPSRELLDVATEMLVYKGAESSSADVDTADLHLAFAQRAELPPAPKGAEPIGSFGSDIRMYLEGTTFTARGDQVYVRIQAEEGEAELTFAPDADPVDAFYGFGFALSTLLKAQGLFGLHAAALVRDGQGLLLVASSDSGKSTATLTLVREGWQHVTDDALLLRADDESVVGLSFRRDFCVDPDAVEHFPELGQHRWPPSPSDPTKWRISLDRLFPGLHTRLCTPVVVTFPQVSSSPASRLVPLEQRIAFEHLMAESAPMATPIPSWVSAQMDVMSRLVAQARCYRLEAGRDVLEAPERFSEMMTDALHAAQDQGATTRGRLSRTPPATR